MAYRVLSPSAFSSASRPSDTGRVYPARPGRMLQVTADEVRELLRGVIDPELGSDIVDLGMVRRIEVSDDGVVNLEVALTTAGCPLQHQIDRDVTAKIASAPDVTDLVVEWSEMT